MHITKDDVRHILLFGAAIFFVPLLGAALLYGFTLLLAVLFGGGN